MAAEREARVRLSLVAGGFLGGLQQVSAQTRTMLATLASASGKAAMAGLSNVKTTLAEMGSGLKSTLATAATFGGAFGVGAAIKQGAELQSRYKDIAFSIERATGQAIRWELVQRKLETTADQHQRRTSELADAFEAIREKSGDASLAMESLGTVATVMNATGKNAKELGDIVGVLGKKFGIGSKDIGPALAQIMSVAKGGTVTFEQLAEDLDELGSIAVQAGLKGSDGFRQILGMVEKTAPGVKDMSETLAGLDQLTEKLRQTPVTEGLFKSIGKQKVSEEFLAAGDAVQRLGVLLKQAGESGKFGSFMREALETEFTGREERQAFMTLAKPFQDAFQEARAQGKDAKEASLAGRKAFDEAVGKMGKGALTYERLVKEAGERADDPQRKLAKAMETFAQEFTKPEALEAMNDLAKSLPKVAQLFAKLTSFAVNNPLLAVGGAVGAKVGLSFASGLLTQAGATIGTAAAVRIKAAAAATGPWKAAGAALGIAAAAWLGFELGKAQIDKAAEGQRKIVSSLAGATTSAEVAAAGGSQKSKEKALQTLRERIELAEREKKETRESVLNKVTFGAAAGVQETFAGGDDQLAKAKAAAKQLEESLSKGSKGGDKAAAALERTAKAAESAALAMAKMKPPGSGGEGANGLPPSPGNGPGYMPR